MSMHITSPAFADGDSIPTRFTCDGLNVSPPLAFGDVPEGAASLALIADDPDAPGRAWVHWVAFRLPPDSSGLAAGISERPQIPGGGLQGRNDFGKLGYGGPCPPRGGPHRYFFTLYALSEQLRLPAGIDKKRLLEAMQGRVLAEGQLMGTYARK